MTTGFFTTVITAMTTMVIAIAMPVEDFDLSQYTIDGGGGMLSSGGGFELSGTVGQPDAGPLSGEMIGGGFSISGGFWLGIRSVGSNLSGDCDGDGDVDLSDLRGFNGCGVGPGGGLLPSCACFDIDNDGDVTVRDFGRFQSSFTGG